MNTETKRALEASIRHWERLTSGKRKSGEGHYAQDCALCKIFHKPNPNNDDLYICDGCPVAERTGCYECRGTPWRHVDRAFFEKESYSTAGFKSAAKKMLRFLKSLRPKSK